MNNSGVNNFSIIQQLMKNITRVDNTNLTV